MRVLVVAAHPDDEALGCGGTMARHVMDGDQVHVLICGTGRGNEEGAMRMAMNAGQALRATSVLNLRIGLEDQRFDAVDRLDIVQAIEKVVAAVQPETVYTHHARDRNLDHRIIADVVFTACRPIPGGTVKRLLSFEVPSSTEWGDGFVPNVFVPLGSEHLARKAAALNAYAEEMRESPHPRSPTMIGARDALRGAQCGFPAAEAFMLIREIL